MWKVLFLRYGLVMVIFFTWLITGFSYGASEFERESLRGLPGVSAASNETEYKPCLTGPGMLRSVDTWERTNKKSARMTVDGQSVTPEEAAEMLIADCSQDLAKITGMAEAMEDYPPAKMIRNSWKENLEFMKWWLKNRHQKLGHPPHE